MPLVFLAIRSVRFVKLVRMPFFTTAFPTQASRIGISKILLKEALVGVAIRSGALFVIGLLVDPFNRFLVPASQGLLITSGEAAGNILSLDFRDPRTFATAVIATPDLVLDLTTQVLQKAAQGAHMIVVEAKGHLEVVGGKLSELKSGIEERLDFS